jgi:hypothetical protein
VIFSLGAALKTTYEWWTAFNKEVVLIKEKIYTFCNRDPESVAHLLFLEGGKFLHPVHNVHAHPGRKVRAALIMLVSWKLWSGYSARVFKNSRTMATIVLTHTKLEARSWTFAGENHLCHLIPGES